METTTRQKDAKNLELWNLVEETDEERTKPVEYGARKFTNIDAYSQIKNATEIRGPYGKNRGLRNVEFTYNTCKDKVSLKVWNAESKKMETKNELVDFTYVTLLAEFYYPAGEVVGKFPIANNIKMGDDAVKKVMTNSICKALSYIWFNADVFLGAFDDDVAKHNDKQNEKIAAATPPAPAPVEPGPKQSHVSGETVDRDMASMSKDKFGCYLTPAEQEVAILEFKGVKWKDLVEKLKARLAPASQSTTPATPSPTPPVVAETPPPTTAPTETTPTATPPAGEGTPPAEKMPREV